MPDQTPVTTNIPDALESAPPTHKTKLTPTEEIEFQTWVHHKNIPSNTPKGEEDPMFTAPDNDYDMRGFWKAQQEGNPLAQQGKNLHFPDTYKTPYHKTFSNESIYATPDAPHWEDNRLIDKTGKVIADETPQTPQTEPEAPAKAEPQPSFWDKTKASIMQVLNPTPPAK